MKSSGWGSSGNHNSHHTLSIHNYSDSSPNPLSHKISSPILSNSQDQQIYIPSGQFKDIATASISLKSPRSNSHSPTSVRHVLSPRHITKFTRSSPQNNANTPKISSPLSPASYNESTAQVQPANNQQVVAYNSNDRSLVVAASSNKSTKTSATTQKKKKKKKRSKPIVTFESHNDSPSPRIDPYQIARMEMLKKLKQNQNIKEKIQTINNIDNSAIMTEDQEQELHHLQHEQLQQQHLQKLHHIQQHHQIEQEQQELEKQRLSEEQTQQLQQQVHLRQAKLDSQQMLHNVNNRGSLMTAAAVDNVLNNPPDSPSELAIRNNINSNIGRQTTPENEYSSPIIDESLFSKEKKKQLSRRRRYQNKMDGGTIMEGQEYNFDVREQDEDFDEDYDDEDYDDDDDTVDLNFSKKASNKNHRFSTFSISSSNTVSTIAESALKEHNIPIFLPNKNREQEIFNPSNVENCKTIQGHRKNEQSVSSVMLDKDVQHSNVVFVDNISSLQNQQQSRAPNENTKISNTKALINNDPSNLVAMPKSVINPFTLQVANVQSTDNNENSHDIHNNKEENDDGFPKSPPQTSYQPKLQLQVSAQAPARLSPNTIDSAATANNSNHNIHSSNAVNTHMRGSSPPHTSLSIIPQPYDVSKRAQPMNQQLDYQLPQQNKQQDQLQDVSYREQLNTQNQIIYISQDPKGFKNGAMSPISPNAYNGVPSAVDPQTSKSEYFSLDIAIGDKVEHQSPEIQNSYSKFREMSKFMSPAERYSIQRTIQNSNDNTKILQQVSATPTHLNLIHPANLPTNNNSMSSRVPAESETLLSTMVSPTSPLFNKGRPKSQFSSLFRNATMNTAATRLRSSSKATDNNTVDRKQTFRRNQGPRIPGTIPYPMYDETIIPDHIEIVKNLPVRLPFIHSEKDVKPSLADECSEINGNINSGPFVFSVNFNESQLSLADPVIKAGSSTNDEDTESSKSNNTVKHGHADRSSVTTNGLSGTEGICGIDKADDPSTDAYNDDNNNGIDTEEYKPTVCHVKQSKSFRKMSFLSEASNSEIDIPSLEDQINKHEEEQRRILEEKVDLKKKVFKTYNIVEKSKLRSFAVEITNLDNLSVFDELGIFDELEITGVSEDEAAVKIKKPMSHTFTIFIDVHDLHPSNYADKDGSFVEAKIIPSKTIHISRITGYLLPFEIKNLEIPDRNKNRSANKVINNNKMKATKSLAREKTEQLLSVKPEVFLNVNAGLRYSTSSSIYNEEEKGDEGAEMHISKHISKLSITSSIYN